MNSLKLLPALSLGLILVACGDPAIESAPIQTVSVEAETSPPEAEVSAPTLSDVPGLIAEGRRDEALTLAAEIIAPMSATERNKLIDVYFDRDSELKNNGIAIVVAETIATLNPDNSKAGYVAGLAYWQGITVEKDAGMMAKYWGVEAMNNNKVVQTRLAEAYADSTSPIYDPAKAATARALAE